MTDFAGGLRLFPNSRLQAGKKADGAVMSGIAGTVRWLHEYTNGTPIPNCDSIVAPGTPANRYICGHDHSGGLMGVPFKQTVWSCMMGRTSAGNAGPHTYIGSTSGNASAENIPTSGWAWQRVFIPPGKVYSNLTPEFLIYSVDYDVSVKCWIKAWDGTEYECNDDASFSTITNNTENQYVTFDDTVPFLPGTVQTFGWRVQIDHDGGTGDPNVYVLSVALHQASETP